MIPPATFYLVWITILYAYKNVPILSSYGASSIAIYLIMAWITMSMFTLEELSEKHILFFQLGSKLKYLIGKWLSILVMMIPLILLAIFFPILADIFRGNMSIELYAVALYSHVVFSLFGIIVGTLFSATQYASKKYAWLSAVLLIVLSISTKSVIEIVPLYKWIAWIFPPVFQVIEHMEGGDEILSRETMVFDVSFVFIYIIAATAGLVWLYRKKES